METAQKPGNDLRKLGNLEFCWAKMDAYAPVIFVGVLHMTHGPDPESLRKALSNMQRQQVLLNVSIRPDRAGYRFCHQDNAPPVPLTCVARDGPDHWRRCAEQELVTGFDTARAPLARCLYLQGDRDSDLIFSFHHSIIDSRSGEAFVDRLLSLCSGAAAGQADRGQNGHGGMLPPLDDLFPSTFRGLAKLRQMAGFLARQMVGEMRYRRRLAGRQKVNAAQPAGCRILSLDLSPEATRNLTRAARRRRLPVNSVLQAAMQIALARVRYPGAAVPMRGISFADLRPYLAPPPAADRLGVYITMLQYVIDMTARPDLWQLASEITDHITRAAKTGDKFAAALVSKNLITFLLKRKSMRMGMVALSYPGPLALARKYGTVQVNGLSGFISNNPLGPELAGFGTIFQGRLRLDLQYLDTDMDSAMADAIMLEIRDLLDTGDNDT